MAAAQEQAKIENEHIVFQMASDLNDLGVLASRLW